MTDASPRFRSVLDSFPAYQPGRTPVSSAGKSHKLSSNESPYAPLPSVIEVIAEEARSVNRYPDNGAEALIAAIAERFTVPARHVAVGCGSVGVTQQLLEGVAVFREARYADAGAHLVIAAGDVHRPLQRLDDALCDLVGGIGRNHLPQDHGEFIAPQARDGVAVLDAGAQALRHDGQQLIARAVSH